MGQSLLDALVEEELGSVVFVGDYLQLDFSHAVFTAYVWPIVTVGRRVLHFGDPGYRDGLCAFIGHEVAGVKESPETGLVIEFGLGEIVTSPRSAELDGPEIALLHLHEDSFRDKAWDVWRVGETPFEALAASE
ncbi:hypothetical protein KV102_07625 [Mumia sp. zg.B53]|uniref:hypothetical protein n=1 Tax=Mumia sp. zg.B53 TaxID=2855449 RepID=UPI001C6E81C6|nr:hypothetical protein [Mumia sp. zg.B53]MBW9214712.1 hypothetical protein [Mumia sp. zg.B53]